MLLVSFHPIVLQGFLFLSYQYCNIQNRVFLTRDQWLFILQCRKFLSTNFFNLHTRKNPHFEPSLPRNPNIYSIPPYHGYGIHERGKEEALCILDHSKMQYTYLCMECIRNHPQNRFQYKNIQVLTKCIAVYLCLESIHRGKVHIRSKTQQLPLFDWDLHIMELVYSINCHRLLPHPLRNQYTNSHQEIAFRYTSK